MTPGTTVPAVAAALMASLSVMTAAQQASAPAGPVSARCHLMASKARTGSSCHERNGSSFLPATTPREASSFLIGSGSLQSVGSSTAMPSIVAAFFTAEYFCPVIAATLAIAQPVRSS